MKLMRIFLFVKLIFILSFVHIQAQFTELPYKYASSEFLKAGELYDDGLLYFTEQKVRAILKTFPENPSADKARLMLAELDLLNRNYVVADGKLSKFIKERNNSPFIAPAMMMRAIIAFENKDYERSEVYFQESYKAAINDAKKRNDATYHEIAAYSIYWEAMSSGARANYHKARPILEQCVKDYPKSELADDAIYAIGQIDEINLEFNDAIANFKKVRIEYPKENTYIASLIREANNNLILRNPAAALVLLERADFTLNSIIKQDSIGLQYKEQSFAITAREEILYLRGESSNLAKNFDQAILYFTAFQETFVDSKLLNHVKLGAGWAYLNKKEYAKALALYDEVIQSTYEKSNKARAIAQLYRVIALKSKGDKEQSRKELSALALQSDYPFLGIVLLELGQLYYEDKDWENARRTLERADREALDPTISTRILLLLGSVYMELEFWDKAAAAYQKAEEMALNSSFIFMPQKQFYITEARLKRGVSLVNAERPAEAIVSLNAYLAEANNDTRQDEGQFWLAEAYFRTDMINNAIQNYTKILERFPNTIRREETLYGLGWCYHRHQNFKKSGEIFDKLLAENPKSKYGVEVLTRQADGYYLMKNYTLASNTYNRVIKLNPTSDEGQYAAYQMSHSLYMAGKYEQAVDALMDFVRRYPRSSYSANAVYLMGWIRFQQQRYSEAIDNYNYLITTFPNSTFIPRAHYSIADAYFNMENYDKAKEKYQYVVENFPTSGFATEAMRGVQQCLVLLGREDEAIQIINDYTTKNEDSPFVRDFKEKGASILFENRRFKDAVSEYENIIKQFPNSAKNSEAIYWIGKSYLSMGNTDEAFKAFLRIQKEYPQSEEAALGMLENGLIQKKLTNIKAADSILNDLVRVYPNHTVAPQAGFERAIMKFNTGDTISSIALYYFVANNYFNNDYADNARYRIANYLRLKELNDSARKEYKILAESLRNPEMSAEANYRIAELWKKDNQIDSAIAAFEVVKEKYSNYEDWFSLSLLNLGEIYEEMKDFAKAEELYNSLSELRAEDDFGKTAKARIKRMQKKK